MSSITAASAPQAAPAFTADVTHALVAPTAPRIRFEFLDGLRGFAALYVVVFHIVGMFDTTDVKQRLPLVLRLLLKSVAFGHYAVDVFIVLSGFCLMLPVARSASGRLTGGFVEYIKRRARRILPPYYAALAFTLILSAVFALAHSLRHGDALQWDQFFFNPTNIGLHLLLLHNLSKAWFFAINPPMWSVATEWQIYFVFPALLLPVWRRMGSVAAVVAGFAVTLPLHYCLSAPHNFDWAAPWYVGLFAMGMLGAHLATAKTQATARLLKRIPWLTVSGILALGTILLTQWHPDALNGPAAKNNAFTDAWIKDALIGAAAVCLILHCVRATQAKCQGAGQESLVLRLLESRFLLWIGGFSYSLYLTHYFGIYMAQQILGDARLAHTGVFLSLMIILPVFSLLAAYVFHLAFERRFMSAPKSGVTPANAGSALLGKDQS